MIKVLKDTSISKYTSFISFLWKEQIKKKVYQPYLFSFFATQHRSKLNHLSSYSFIILKKKKRYPAYLEELQVRLTLKKKFIMTVSYITLKGEVCLCAHIFDCYTISGKELNKILFIFDSSWQENS